MSGSFFLVRRGKGSAYPSPPTVPSYRVKDLRADAGSHPEGVLKSNKMNESEQRC